jgi:hypothetical protein
MYPAIEGQTSSGWVLMLPSRSRDPSVPLLVFTLVVIGAGTFFTYRWLTHMPMEPPENARLVSTADVHFPPYIYRIRWDSTQGVLRAPDRKSSR